MGGIVFQQPGFLYGLLALAVPVIIHLFNFQKPKVVYFSNVNFLKTANENTRKGIALKKWLVLLARMLFMLFVVLAFAQPVWVSESTATASKKNRAIFLDNSLSMQMQVANGSAMEAAIGYVQKIAQWSDKTSTFRYLDQDFKYKDQYNLDPEQLSDRTTEVSYSLVVRNFNTIHQKLTQPTLGNTKPQEVLWFSDFQKQGQGLPFVPDTAIQYQLFPIQNPQQSNVAVDSAWLEVPMVQAGQPNHLKVVLANYGPKEKRDLAITCKENQKLVGNASVTLGPGEKKVVDFGFLGPANGTSIPLTIQIEDFPVVFDNTYYLNISSSPPIPVCLISNNSLSFVRTLFKDHPSFRFLDVSPKSIPYEELRNMELIVLEDFDQIDGNLVSYLNEFVAKGGHLVLVPSEQSRTESLAAWASRFGIASLTPISSAEKVAIQMPNAKDPFFFGIFENTQENVTPPKVTSVIQWSTLDKNVLIDQNNVPFLSEKGYLKGKIHVFSSPLDKKNTDFPSHALFLPTFFKMAMNSHRSSQELSFRANQKTIRIQIPSSVTIAQGQSMVMVKDNNKWLIPEQNKTENQWIIQWPPDAIQPGFYTISTSGFSQTLAINVPLAESDMSFFTPEELKKIYSNYPNVNIADVASEASVAQISKAEGLFPYWKICLILALVFLLVEILLIRFFK